MHERELWVHVVYTNGDQGFEVLCIYVFFLFLSFILILNKVSLCISGCSGTHSVNQVGLELKDPYASVSQVLGLKVWTPPSGLFFFFLL